MPFVFNQWAYDISQAGNSRLTVVMSREQFIYLMAVLYSLSEMKNWEITGPIDGFTQAQLDELPGILADKWAQTIEDVAAGTVEV